MPRVRPMSSSAITTSPMNATQTPSVSAPSHMFSIVAPMPIISPGRSPPAIRSAPWPKRSALGAEEAGPQDPATGRPRPAYSSTVRESEQVLRGGTLKRPDFEFMHTLVDIMMVPLPSLLDLPLLAKLGLNEISIKHRGVQRKRAPKRSCVTSITRDGPSTWA